MELIIFDLDDTLFQTKAKVLVLKDNKVVRRLTNQQYNVLRILRGQHPKSISTCGIKERMLDRNSDVSRIVDRLTLKNWVTKETCPNDRRLVDVMITDDGLSLLKKMDDAIDRIDQELGNLTEKDAELLNELLDRIRE